METVLICDFEAHKKKHEETRIRYHTKFSTPKNSSFSFLCDIVCVFGGRDTTEISFKVRILLVKKEVLIFNYRKYN